MKSPFSRLPVFLFSRFLVFSLILLIAQASAFDVVDIPDPNLKIVIRETLALPDEIPITQQEMLRLKKLWIESLDLKDLTGLEYAANLEDLSLAPGGIVSDLTPISALTSLKKLVVVDTPISDIRPLAGLINLEELILRRTQISDLAPISTLISLEELFILDTPISDIHPLAGLINLEELMLRRTQIRDITPLANLTNLIILYLVENKVEDIAPLANLTALEELRLEHNRITDITPLANLTALETLRLDDNAITDITSLANLTALKTLRLDINAIANIIPLANLTALEELRLNRNRITDITPLAGLKNLKKLRLADNPIHDFSPLLQLEGVGLDIEIDLSQLDKLNAVVEVPDPNLRQAIREALFLPDGEPLIQSQMLRLTHLQVESSELNNLTGLEHATNLESMSLGGTGMVSDLIPISNLIELRSLNLADNQIQDIRPLSNLINLKVLNLWNNQIQDITPLANLTRLIYLNSASNDVENLAPLAGLIHLRTLNLSTNQIEDITPLANLTGLITLKLSYNRISNFSPLANLVNLEDLRINNNFGTDISSLSGLKLIKFRYDTICDIAPYAPNVTERIASRRYPSIFSPGGLDGPEHKTQDEPATLYDLYAYKSWFGLEWLLSESEPTFGLSTQVGGNIEYAQETRLKWHQLNPNLVNVVSTSWFATGFLGRFPPDSEFWLRDENGDILKLDIRGRWFEYQTDFLHPGLQDLLVERIVAIANCGLYDGLLLDGFRRNATRFPNRHLRPQSDEEIIAAMTSILSRVRARVRDDFLILANGNRSKLTAYTEYINGIFMETTYDYATEYTHSGFAEIESTLLWSEENLREPRANCLEGWGIGSEAPDSPANKQRMRLFTTMSLTHSDGYVVYTTGAGEYGGSDHAHIWHDFWDADLGYPIGPKGQRYKDTPGLFIREFTNGWAVYNRSGKIQTVSLTESATGVSSGKSGITHILPDLDGEMYLKGKNPADVNDDGKVNVLDLVQVANRFGKSTPDPNGDGAVNILDLVFVAQQFSQ